MKKKSEKIHLAIDCRMIHYSGIGTYIKNLLPQIIGSDVFLITALGVHEELEKFNWFEKVKLIELKSKPLSIYEQLELPLKVPVCDIYWSPNINGSILPTRARTRVTTIHDVNHLANPGQHSKLHIAFIKLLITTGIHHSKSIITVSAFSKREIIRFTGCRPQKISVFPLAVEENFDKDFRRTEVSENYLLFVGNVKPNKNLENALKAFKNLEDQEVRFFIVGKKEGFISGYHNISTLISDLGERVFFTGRVSDEQLKNYYSNAKAFIFPSKYEGFGLPVLEAMKFYVPIIASNAASIPEVGGNAIIYFDPENIDQIREKMEVVLAASFIVDREKYQLQLSRFNWQTTAQGHIELFKTAIGKKEKN